MRRAVGLCFAAIAATASVSLAGPVLQFDVNGFNAQAFDSGGAASSFGGAAHSGSVRFTIGTGVLNGISIRAGKGSPFVSAGFSGYTMSNFVGQLNLSSGQVTGGSITVSLNNGDTYTTGITPGSGFVTAFVGGGFKIEAMTRQGFFNDSLFGNVDVSPWYAAQNPGGLLGSFFEFSYRPNANGAGTSDMDMFVNAEAVPLPPTSWAALGTMAGILVMGRVRRR